MLDGSNSDYSQVTGWTYGTSMGSLLSQLTVDTSSWTNWHPSRTGVQNYANFVGNNKVFNSSWITGWDMSYATNLIYMFFEADAFNQPIGTWNTSNVTNMYGMFQGTLLFNQDIGDWDVSSVTNMDNMFYNSNGFNNGGSTGINNWSPSSCTSMYSMFDGAAAFNQPIGSWDVSNVQLMTRMFYDGIFNQPLSGWNTSNVIETLDMFRRNSTFNQDIGMWNTSNLINPAYMFAGDFQGQNFNNGGSPSISGWDMSNVTTLRGMFYYCTGFNQPIGSWDTSKVTDIFITLGECTSFDQDLSNWVVTGVTNALLFMISANGLSTTNYDRTLSGWSSQAVQNGVNIHFGGSQYSTATGLAYRNALVASGWTITDGGAA